MAFEDIAVKANILGALKFTLDSLAPVEAFLTGKTATPVTANATNNGKLYLIDVGATAPWDTHVGELVIIGDTAGVYYYYAPRQGMLVYDESTETYWYCSDATASPPTWAEGFGDDVILGYGNLAALDVAPDWIVSHCSPIARTYGDAKKHLNNGDISFTVTDPNNTLSRRMTEAGVKGRSCSISCYLGDGSSTASAVVFTGKISDFSASNGAVTFSVRDNGYTYEEEAVGIQKYRKITKQLFPNIPTSYEAISIDNPISQLYGIDPVTRPLVCVSNNAASEYSHGLGAGYTLAFLLHWGGVNGTSALTIEAKKIDGTWGSPIYGTDYTGADVTIDGNSVFVVLIDPTNFDGTASAGKFAAFPEIRVRWKGNVGALTDATGSANDDDPWFVVSNFCQTALGLTAATLDDTDGGTLETAATDIYDLANYAHGNRNSGTHDDTLADCPSCGISTLAPQTPAEILSAICSTYHWMYYWNRDGKLCFQQRDIPVRRHELSDALEMAPGVELYTYGSAGAITVSLPTTLAEDIYGRPNLAFIVERRSGAGNITITAGGDEKIVTSTGGADADDQVTMSGSEHVFLFWCHGSGFQYKDITKEVFHRRYFDWDDTTLRDVNPSNCSKIDVKSARTKPLKTLHLRYGHRSAYKEFGREFTSQKIVALGRTHQKASTDLVDIWPAADTEEYHDVYYDAGKVDATYTVPQIEKIARSRLWHERNGLREIAAVQGPRGLAHEIGDVVLVTCADGDDGIVDYRTASEGYRNRPARMLEIVFDPETFSTILLLEAGTDNF